MKSLQAFIPHFIIIKGSAPLPPSANGKEDASIWWANDLYTKAPRYRALRWLGINWLKFPYKETIKDNYFIPATDLVAVVKDLQAAGIVPKLDSSSKIFEGGCNVGRNLYALQSEFGAHVSGLDISQEALKLAETEIWKDRPNHKFHQGNALTTNLFDSIPDKHYDLVITRWHLIHIALSDEKRRYVQNLKRIAKTFVMFEPVTAGRSGIEYYQNKSYCLSWDDWAKEYGLKEFRSAASEAIEKTDGTRTFYKIN